MSVTDRIRWWLVDQRFEFWMDYEGVPRRRRRQELAELRTTRSEAASAEGRHAARPTAPDVRELARAIGEGYPARPQWSVGAYLALPVFALMLYSYVLSSMAFLEGCGPRA